MFRSLFATTVLAIASAAAQAPDPVQIMKGARIAATLEKNDLAGNLIKDGKKTPVSLFLRNENIQFAFQEGGAAQHFHLRLGEGKYDLFDVAPDNKTTIFPAEKLVKPIAGTDLTYEDLSLQFFYWPDPKLEGIEPVGGENCYKIRLDKPKGSGGRYEVVYVWVHAKQGAFMQVCGFNKAGGMVKKFHVDEIMQVGGGVYTLHKMTISTMNPATNPARVVSETTLIFDKPTSAAPSGLKKK